MVTFEALQQGKETLAVVGLGYVGLPLAVALSRQMSVLGFDISAPRIKEPVSYTHLDVYKRQERRRPPGRCGN